MSGMSAYFIRRLMLVPITFLVITFVVYAILRVVPGGPIEQAETAMKMAAMRGEGGGGSSGGSVAEGDLQLDARGLKELEEYYALDRPILVGYLQWLGLWQRSFKTRVPASTMEKHGEAFKPLKDLFAKQGERETELDEFLAPKGHVVFRGRLYRTLSDEEVEKLKADEKRAEELRGGGYGKLDDLLAFLETKGHTYANGKYCAVLTETELAEDKEYTEKALSLIAAIRAAGEKREQIAAQRGFEINEVGLIYKVEKRLSGIVQLDFGRSYTHNEPVLGLIGSKMEISIQFGLIGYLLTWLVCVPLGVYKAIKHHSFFDTASSFVVFLGYSIPGFVVCMLLLVGVAVNVDWLPLGGYKPDNIEQLTYLQAFLGRVRHMLIPITGYMIGSFATMTILMKNSLIENLGADYVRTAFAKGLSEKRVIFVHALRNSLIPITAGIGHAVGILFAGSFLIEKVCNIPGLGLMGYEAMVQRDYPIILATLVIGVAIRLFGNILSDIIWAMIDPRIRFGASS
jgi:microcin C transport system permease protein